MRPFLVCLVAMLAVAACADARSPCAGGACPLAVKTAPTDTVTATAVVVDRPAPLTAIRAAVAPVKLGRKLCHRLVCRRC